jgi:CHASE2 domain-containing sensor protein
VKQGEPVEEQPVNNKPPGIQEPAGDPRNEPIKTPWVKVILVTTLTGFLLSLAFYTGLFGLLRLDDFIDRRFWGYADGYVDKSLSRDIAIIVIEEDPDKNGSLGKFGASWRGHHAELINALSAVEVKAKVIAFDMYFEDASPENDEKLGRAIQSATRSGTMVVLGSRTYSTIKGRQVPKITQRLTDYLDKSNWALLVIGVYERGSSLIDKVKLGDTPSEELPPWVSIHRQQITPSLPLRAAMHFWAGQQQPIAVFDSDRDRIDVQTPEQAVLRSIPVTSAVGFTFDIADKNDLSNISHPYHEVLGNLNNSTYLGNIFGGKIVIVGVRAARDLRDVSRDEKQYGVEIVAAATSNLLQGVYIQPVSSGYQYIIIIVMSLIGALLPTLFRNFMRYRIPIKPLTLAEVRVDIPLVVGAVCLLYVLLAFFVYVQTRRTMGIQYHLAALIVTFTLMKVTTRSSQTRAGREET